MWTGPGGDVTLATDTDMRPAPCPPGTIMYLNKLATYIAAGKRTAIDTTHTTRIITKPKQTNINGQ
jgi:hypothetical protein